LIIAELICSLIDSSVSFCVYKSIVSYKGLSYCSWWFDNCYFCI